MRCFRLFTILQYQSGNLTTGDHYVLINPVAGTLGGPLMLDYAVIRTYVSTPTSSTTAAPSGFTSIPPSVTMKLIALLLIWLQDPPSSIDGPGACNRGRCNWWCPFGHCEYPLHILFSAPPLSPCGGRRRERRPSLHLRGRHATAGLHVCLPRVSGLQRQEARSIFYIALTATLERTAAGASSSACSDKSCLPLRGLLGG
jgi:hypothetical protein